MGGPHDGEKLMLRRKEDTVMMIGQDQQGRHWLLLRDDSVKLFQRLAPPTESEDSDSASKSRVMEGVMMMIPSAVA